MPSGHETSLSPEVLTHLYIENQVTLDLLVSDGHFIQSFLPCFEGRAYILHFLAYGIPPKCVAIFCVESLRLLDRLWDFNAELVRSHPIFGLDLGDYPIPLLERERNPPGKRWLGRDFRRHRVLGQLNRTCFFGIFQWHPSGTAILPLNENFPPNSRFLSSPRPHRRDNEPFFLFELLPVCPVIQYLREHHVPVPFWIDLSKQVFRYSVRRQGRTMTIRELHFIDAGVQDRIVVCRSDRQTVLITKAFDHSANRHFTSGTRQSQFHIQISVIEHIRCEPDISLRQVGITNHFVEFLLEIWVEPMSCVPIAWVCFTPFFEEMPGIAEPPSHSCVKCSTSSNVFLEL